MSRQPPAVLRRSRRPRASRSAAAGYALAWLAAAALVVAAALGLHRASSSSTPRATGALGPVTATADRAGCVLRHETGRVARSDVAVLQPPTLGPPAAPAAPGIYTRAPATASLVGALRRGLVVVQYRPDAPRRAVRRARAAVSLSALWAIVTPDRTGMRYAVAATAWGRVLGCPHVTPAAVRAIRAFAVRYHGTGPDRAAPAP